MVSDVGLGFLLVTGAGMSTALGAACVFSERLVQLASKRVLAAALALSAGVMLYVSFVEIFVKAQGAFADAGQGESDAYLSARGASASSPTRAPAMRSLVYCIYSRVKRASAEPR